ncbi:hypothetical protein EMIT0111MI5_250009 [Burkholderia sp. IT-111MI5]
MNQPFLDTIAIECILNICTQNSIVTHSVPHAVKASVYSAKPIIAHLNRTGNRGGWLV